MDIFSLTDFINSNIDLVVVGRFWQFIDDKPRQQKEKPLELITASGLLPPQADNNIIGEHVDIGWSIGRYVYPL